MVAAAGFVAGEPSSRAGAKSFAPRSVCARSTGLSAAIAETPAVSCPSSSRSRVTLGGARTALLGVFVSQCSAEKVWLSFS